MKSLGLANPEKVRVILNTFAWLDAIRWATIENYNSINYAHADLTDDEKLLTHWLCYITNRQMAYKPVFDVGGYVFSDLVRTYSRNPHKQTRDVLEGYLRMEGGSWRVTCPVHRRNATLERYGLTDEASFSSRYMPDDLVRIFRTLAILDSFSERSLAHFLVKTTDWTLDRWHIVRRLAQSLNQLTYSGGGKVSEKQFKQALDKTAEQAKEFTLTKSQPSLFNRKRLWCTLRDYLKSKEFNPIFVAALRAAGRNDADHWKSDNPEMGEALAAIELPGDVWNNAPVFRKGLFSPYIVNERPSWKMPETIRKVYECVRCNSDLTFYPEQLDVSFDFVPKMCDRMMCDVCMFGNGVKSLCHQQAGMLCPVVLVACGYRHKCDPRLCSTKQDLAKGLCAIASSNGRLPQ